MLSTNRRKRKNPLSLPVLNLHIADPSASLVGVDVFVLPDPVLLLSSLLHDEGALAKLKYMNI
jgi:hypothetical protein